MWLPLTGKRDATSWAERLKVRKASPSFPTFSFLQHYSFIFLLFLPSSISFLFIPPFSVFLRPVDQRTTDEVKINRMKVKKYESE